MPAPDDELLPKLVIPPELIDQLRFAAQDLDDDAPEARALAAAIGKCTLVPPSKPPEATLAERVAELEHKLCCIEEHFAKDTTAGELLQLQQAYEALQVAHDGLQADFSKLAEAIAAALDEPEESWKAKEPERARRAPSAKRLHDLLSIEPEEPKPKRKPKKLPRPR